MKPPSERNIEALRAITIMKQKTIGEKDIESLDCKQKICLYCGKVFTKKPRKGLDDWNKQKFCSRECANLGTKKTPPNLSGHKFSKEHNEKISKARIGMKFSEETKKKIGDASKGRKHTEQWKKEMSARNSGKNNSMYGKTGELSPAWKNGGASKINKWIRTCFEYRQWRSDVFTRDEFTCQECGARGIYLEAHHIKSFSSILKEYNIKTIEQALECQELWNINNGITLCKECHKLTDSYPNNLI